VASPLCAEAIEPAAGVRFPPRAPVGAVHGREGPPIHIESRGAFVGSACRRWLSTILR